jgi:proteasome lid subunit RPN8/RPN11
MIRVVLAPADRARIENETRAALPRECCGLIEGRRNGGDISVYAVHAVRNAAAGAERFEIDSAEHIRLLRAARVRGNDIVGCYHSHPGAQAEPSPRDRVGAAEDGFLWLIAGSDTGAVELRGYLFQGGEFTAVDLVETA